MLVLSGCTSIAKQAEIAGRKIKLTTNPAEVGSCQSKGIIPGVSTESFTVLHGGEWLVEEVTKRGGNTILLPDYGIERSGIFGTGRFGAGEAYLCPGPDSKDKKKD